jgi:hypothetical protein
MLAKHETLHMRNGRSEPMRHYQMLQARESLVKTLRSQMQIRWHRRGRQHVYQPLKYAMARTTIATARSTT